MRVSNLFVCISIFVSCANHSIASHDGIVRPVSYPPAASARPSVTTVLHVTGPHDGRIAENNLWHFESVNKDALDALEQKKLFSGESSEEDMEPIKNLIMKIYKSDTNIATQLRYTPREMLDDFKQYLDIVWDESHPYKVQTFGSLEDLQDALIRLSTILHCASKQLN